jgi:hypothetical protein
MSSMYGVETGSDWSNIARVDTGMPASWQL